MTRIYLDNAATSWPKPEAVYAAVDRYQRELGAPAGRSGYAEAVEVSVAVEQARRDVARLIGVKDSKRIVFCLNGTDALNLAIHGLVRSGDHVVTTVVEHNSVLRPLRLFEEQDGVSVTRIDCRDDGVIDAGDIRQALRPETRLIAITHASNVTGALQPIAEVGRIARQAGVTLLIDAAQTLGHMPLDVEELGADLLAAPGHKGLLGPLGTGLLYIRPGVEQQLQSVRQGGTGTQSEDDHQPDDLPGKYEAGNLNVPGILGLGAAVGFLNERGLPQVREHCEMLTTRLLAGLSAIEAVRVYGPNYAARRVGVVSLTIEGYDPQEVAAMLDAAHRIQVRPGLHCAPLMHRRLGTANLGGTVRFSVGVFTTEAEIDAAVEAIASIAADAVTS